MAGEKEEDAARLIRAATQELMQWMGERWPEPSYGWHATLCKTAAAAYDAEILAISLRAENPGRIGGSN